jgi:hypothetical protein
MFIDISRALETLTPTDSTRPRLISFWSIIFVRKTIPNRYLFILIRTTNSLIQFLYTALNNYLSCFESQSIKQGLFRDETNTKLPDLPTLTGISKESSSH